MEADIRESKRTAKQQKQKKECGQINTGMDGDSTAIHSNVSGIQNIHEMRQGNIHVGGDVFYVSCDDGKHETIWHCLPLPDRHISQVLREACRQLGSSIREFCCATLRRVARRSLIFSFAHTTREDAIDMIVKHKRVKEVFLDFVQKLDPSIKDIRIEVELRELCVSDEQTTQKAETRPGRTVNPGQKEEDAPRTHRQQKDDDETSPPHTQEKDDNGSSLSLSQQKEDEDASLPHDQKDKDASHPHPQQTGIEDTSHSHPKWMHAEDTSHPHPKRMHAEDTSHPHPKRMHAEDTSHPHPKRMHTEDTSHPHPKRMKKALSDPSQDPSQSEGISLSPETGQESASQVTPSRACTDHSLYDASGRGDLEEVRLILATGLVNINCRVGLGRRTLVIAAAWSGHREVVELLVSKGADVSLVDGGGNNSLHYACCGGDAETVKSVLSPNVVDIDGRGWRRRTPMMEAADRGHREVVELLVSKGANVSLVDGGGNNSLHYACCGGDVETVKYVLSLNVVDIDGRGEVSRTPVMCAARWRNREVVEFLVSKGANVSLVDKDGNNILHLASGEGDVETVKFVVSLNVVDINARNNIGLTAADRARDWARDWARRQLLDLLVSHGAQ